MSPLTAAYLATGTSVLQTAFMVALALRDGGWVWWLAVTLSAASVVFRALAAKAAAR